MKLSKILSKRVLSLLIVGLFVFTALAVIQSGGTNTASIHSVSSPTSSLPYTTTSNGLTYTVEPNGTYLWNGHYLRDPPVPYPKIPTIAPDGLPYGAVGPVGAQGQVGAKSFSKGTPQITGVSPATTAGTDTLINTNTFWGNETISAVGNITISPGDALTVYNSIITFTEPASTVTYSYGFNLSSGTSTSVPKLLLEHGTVINQSSPTDNSWFIYIGPTTVYVEPSHRYWDVAASNTTVYTPSHTVPSKSFSKGIFFTYFNYSTYQGMGQYTINDSLNATSAQHSFFGNGSAIVNDAGNNTFYHNMAGFILPWDNGYVDNSYYSNATNSISINYTSFIHDGGEQPFYIFATPNWTAPPANAGTTQFLTGIYTGVTSLLPQFGAMSLYMVRTSFYDTNWSADPSYPWAVGIVTGPNQYDHGVIDIQNSSFTNSYHTVPGTVYPNIGGDERSLIAGQVPIYNDLNTTIYHVSIVNLSAGNKSTSAAATGLINGGLANVNFEYNLVNGLHNMGNSEPDISFFSQSMNFSFNKFENFQNVRLPLTGPPYAPYAQTGVMNDNDQGTQSYTWSSTWLNVTNNTQDSKIPNLQGAYSRQADNNWYVNFSNFAVAMQGNGYYMHYQNNTFVNFSNSAAIAPANGEFAAYPFVENNTGYGFYNYSVFTGDLEGGSYKAFCYNNQVYDIGAHSFAYFGQTSSSTSYDINGAVLLGNANGTYLGGPGLLLYRYNTSQFTFINSHITSLTLGAYVPGTVLFDRRVLPTDFNLTFDNTYLPSTFAMWDQNAGVGQVYYGNYTLTGTNLSSGIYSTTLHTNPSFLNLTGYLGIYSGQTYTLNASNIKNEASLPIYYSGNEIADIPASSAHYNFTALGVDKYSISTPSSKSDPVKLYFQGIADALYDVEMISNGTVVSTFTEYANATGVLNTTYNPSTMPLDPIFTVAYVGSVASPPVVPPLVPIVPHVLFGIPYLNVIVLFGGIALASEEFFRTQTKGKEKKYSYTGVFVGIMIAGIGLMSVL